MSARELANQVYQHAERILGRMAKPLAGIVQSYDPAHYAVKIAVQPEGFLSGWLPLDTPGIGLYAPPNIGDVVDVEFEQGDIQAGRVKGVRYGGRNQPLTCPSGERWFVHPATGSFLKLHNDGSLEIYSAQGTSLTAGGSVTINATGNVSIIAVQFNAQAQVNITGNVAVTGNITATGTITDNTSSTPHTL